MVTPIYLKESDPYKLAFLTAAVFTSVLLVYLWSKANRVWMRSNKWWVGFSVMLALVAMYRVEWMSRWTYDPSSDPSVTTCTLSSNDCTLNKMMEEWCCTPYQATAFPFSLFYAK